VRGQRARTVLDHGAPELQQAVERGQVSVTAGFDLSSIRACTTISLTGAVTLMRRCLASARKSSGNSILSVTKTLETHPAADRHFCYRFSRGEFQS
jgi:hypothetical protein